MKGGIGAEGSKMEEGHTNLYFSLSRLNETTQVLALISRPFHKHGQPLGSAALDFDFLNNNKKVGPGTAGLTWRGRSSGSGRSGSSTRPDTAATSP